MYQIVCWLGLRPKPHWGTYSAPPDPIAGLGGGAPGEREEGREGKMREGRGWEGVPECPNPELASLVKKRTAGKEVNSNKLIN